ncbi:MAG: MTAP family purine nucleoside phosphorylase [Tepidisphaeraceae bacterium]
MSDLRIGLIGGSGLGATLAGGEGTLNYIDTPFGPTSGPIIETTWDGVPVFLLARHGPGHTLNPSKVPYRANLFAMKKLGVTHILASGAVGSLRQEFKPGDLVIVDQVIDKTRRDATFYDRAAVHVEFAEPFCPVLRGLLQQVEPTAHASGCYVAMEGPAFSTRAESLMHRLWGGDLIGMTAMPEAKLAREAEIPYALIAMVTDYDCWRVPEPTAARPEGSALLKEIIGNLTAASARALDLMKRAIAEMAKDPAKFADCPASRALELAIWSDRQQISQDEVERLAPLWVKYFR